MRAQLIQRLLVLIPALLGVWQSNGPVNAQDSRPEGTLNASQANLAKSEPWQGFGQALAKGETLQAWSMLSAGGIQVDVESGDASAFEYLNMHHDGQGGLSLFHRMLAGNNDGAAFLAYLNDSQLPSWIGINDSLFVLAENGSWKVTKTGWNLIFQPGGERSPFRVNEQNMQVKVALKVSKYLADISKDADIRWLPTEMAFQATDARGTLWVTLNSPNDQRVHGYPFSGLRFFRQHRNSTLRFRGITRNPSMVPELHYDSADLPADIHVVPSSQLVLAVPPIKGTMLNKSALRFWSHVSSYTLINGAGIPADPKQYDMLPLRERSHLLIGLLTEYQGGEHLTMAVVHCSKLVRDLLAHTQSQGISPSLPDDPSLRWRMLELQLGEIDLRAFAGEMANIAAQPSTPLAEAALLTRLQIMIGEPPLHAPNAWRYPLNGEQIDADRQRTLHALRNAAWGYGADESTIDYCRHLIRENQPGTAPSNLAIDGLLRLGLADEISRVHLDAWFASGVVHTEPVLRSYHLSVLTMSSSGRKYLISWLQENAPQDEAWGAAIEKLKARLEATRETSRYDFMSPTECETTRGLLDSLR